MEQQQRGKDRKRCKWAAAVLLLGTLVFSLTACNYQRLLERELEADIQFHECIVAQDWLVDDCYVESTSRKGRSLEAIVRIEGRLRTDFSQSYAQRLRLTYELDEHYSPITGPGRPGMDADEDYWYLQELVFLD